MKNLTEKYVNIDWSGICSDFNLEHGDITPDQSFEMDRHLGNINEILHAFINQNKPKEYINLWVLDFNDNQVYKYSIEKDLYNDYPEYPEEYMENLGHDTNNVQWMVSPYDEVLDENNGWDVAD